MIAPLGHLLLVMALVVAVLGAAAAFAGGWQRDAVWESWGRRAAFAVFALVAAAVALMEVALLGHDFSVKYVADVGSRETPLYYTVISLWAALEGSILFWTFLLSIYTVLFLRLYGRRFPEITPYVTGILLAVSGFFLLVMAGPGSPFIRESPAPADGPGPNVLLQNHPMMGLHPPLLYLGYVGLTVPFAIAMASLLRGIPDPDTLRLIRRWALVPWIFLSLGIVAGMWWSYAVLGWGGYWSWDPVENAAVMPWLVTTAFLHSLQVQERRQMLKAWTISLIVAAFLLTLLGTLITRSGVLQSVHAFTEAGIGPVFLGFLALVLVFSLVLLLYRSRELAAPGVLDASICRETVFLFNNLLLVAATVTILLGTMFPLIGEALQGTQLSVGAPYFNQVEVPVGVALLFLMGVGPALPWGAARLEELQYRLLGPIATGVGIIVLLLLIGVRGIDPLVTFGLAGFVLAVTLGRVLAEVRVRRGNSGERWPAAAGRLWRANPRRYGGYLVHLGVLLIVIGVAASQAYGQRTAATLRPGQSMRLAGYTITYAAFRPQPQANRMVLAAEMRVSRAGHALGTMSPSLNVYPAQEQPVVTPAIREEPWDLVYGLVQGRSPWPDLAVLTHGQNPFEDLYLVLQAVNTHGTAASKPTSVTVQVLVNPMVGFIWLGGIIVGLGGIFALTPARRRRRLAAREIVAGQRPDGGLAAEEVPA